MKSTAIATLLAISSATAVAQNGANDAANARSACIELNRAAKTLAAGGHLAEAEAFLRTATVSGDDRSQGSCAGLVLTNIAFMMAVVGRNDDAERLAEQSLRTLEKHYPPNHWTLLRPLQILASVRLESGRTARAREVVKRMQSIRIEVPEDRAIVHVTAGAVLQVDGRRSEAEAEYHDAFRALEEAGHSESADAGAIFHCLGSLYLAEHRLDEAWGALDRARAIYDRAKDAVPADRMKLLDLRGVLYARLGEWKRSEQDLRDAVAMIDGIGQSSVDPAFLRSLFRNYSYVLRSNHHRREARSIEARTSALPTNHSAAAIVDVSDLLAEKKAAKK